MVHCITTCGGVGVLAGTRGRTNGLQELHDCVMFIVLCERLRKGQGEGGGEQGGGGGESATHRVISAELKKMCGALQKSMPRPQLPFPSRILYRYTGVRRGTDKDGRGQNEVRQAYQIGGKVHVPARSPTGSKLLCPIFSMHANEAVSHLSHTASHVLH